MKEEKVNEYTVRVWRDQYIYLDTVTIVDKEENIRYQSNPWSHYKVLDLTNDGQQEIVIWQYSGGVHGAYQIQGYESDVRFTKIIDTPPSMCDGEFKDVNGDGILEFRTCDDAFVYFNLRCSYPFVNAIFQYQPGAGYKLANLENPQIYAESIAFQTQRILDFKIMPYWDQDNLTDEVQCNILPLILSYLYSGQEEKAWKVLDDHYPFQDIDEFRKDIESRVNKSPFFIRK